jgi:hypothetical protein
MVGSDFRPGLENQFVWTGQSRRNRWRLGAQIATMCAVCLGGGYYVGRASVDQPASTLATASTTAQHVPQKQLEPARSTQAAADNGAPSQPVAQKASPQPAPSAQGPSPSADDKAETGGAENADAAEAAGKATSPAPVRVINADADKPPAQEPDAQAGEKSRRSQASLKPPRKKSDSAEHRKPRSKPAAERAGSERDDAYVAGRARPRHDDAYIPPPAASSRGREPEPGSRVGYERPPGDRYGAAEESYREPMRSRRGDQADDDAYYEDPFYPPRNRQGYLREFRGDFWRY